MRFYESLEHGHFTAERFQNLRKAFSRRGTAYHRVNREMAQEPKKIITKWHAISVSDGKFLKSPNSSDSNRCVLSPGHQW